MSWVTAYLVLSAVAVEVGAGKAGTVVVVVAFSTFTSLCVACWVPLDLIKISVPSEPTRIKVKNPQVSRSTISPVF